MRRQTHPLIMHPPIDYLMALAETTSVAQIHILDEHPGPSAHLFVDGEFWDWMPGLTYERAERNGNKL